MVQTKGGSQEWMAETIVFTCPLPPWEVYSTREDICQLLRRIAEIRHFTDLTTEGNVLSRGLTDAEGCFEAYSEWVETSTPAWNTPPLSPVIDNNF